MATEWLPPCRRLSGLERSELREEGIEPGVHDFALSLRRTLIE
jgi:hypothetical protein